MTVQSMKSLWPWVTGIGLACLLQSTAFAGLGDKATAREDQGDATAAMSSEQARQSLPEDGGLPGAALRAHFSALADGDWSALKAVAASGIREMMPTM